MYTDQLYSKDNWQILHDASSLHRQQLTTITDVEVGACLKTTWHWRQQRSLLVGVPYIFIKKVINYKTWNAGQTHWLVIIHGEPPMDSWKRIGVSTEPESFPYMYIACLTVTTAISSSQKRLISKWHNFRCWLLIWNAFWGWFLFTSLQQNFVNILWIYMIHLYIIIHDNCINVIINI